MSKRKARDVMKEVYGTKTYETDIFNGKPYTAGRRKGKPKGVVIHNDYGAMSGIGYNSWLKRSRLGGRNPHKGYAHYYSSKDSSNRVASTNNGAYHAGHSWANSNLIGFEVCQSLRKATTDTQFRYNEEVVFIQAAEDLLFYGIPINTSTVRLHNEYGSTSCPHRSWELHVGRGQPYTKANKEKLKRYFVGRISYWAKVLKGETAVPEWNYLPENKGGSNKPSKPTPKPSGLTLAQVIDKTIAGDYGSIPQRKTNIERQTNFSYKQVQDGVNAKLLGKPKPKTSGLTLAQVIDKTIAGDYGSMPQRKTNIEKKTNFSYKQVQDGVNAKLLGKKTSSRGYKVGDKVTTHRVFGTGNTASVAGGSVTGYIETINNNWRNPYRLEKTKGRKNWLGFVRKIDIK